MAYHGTQVVGTDGAVIARSRNLRGMRDYARVSRVVSVDATKRNAHKDDPVGNLTVTYANGATCRAEFCSYNIMVDFVRNRRSWRGADITLHGGDMGYLTSPGIIAG